LQHDWSYFQGALQLLQTAATLADSVSNFDRQLRTVISNQRYLLFGALFQVHKDSTYQTIPCVHLHEEPEKARRLWAFFQTLDVVGVKLLPAAAQKLVSFNESCQSFVYDTMFHSIKDQLTVLPSLSAWQQPDEVKVANVEVPTFSKQPLPYITQIGEHLFDLPQQLEPFAATHPAFSHIPGGSSAENHEDDAEAHDFAWAWINAVARGTMSLYVQRILEIPSLTTQGALQLAADIGYLCTILSALRITPSKSLTSIQRLLSLPVTELMTPHAEEEGTEATYRAQIAKMRTQPPK